MTRQKYFRYGVVHFCSKSDEKGKLELKLNTPYKKEVNIFFTFADLFCSEQQLTVDVLLNSKLFEFYRSGFQLLLYLLYLLTSLKTEMSVIMFSLNLPSRKCPQLAQKKDFLFFSALFSSHCTPGQSVILYSLPFPPRPLYLVGSRTASTARLLPSDPHLAGSDGDITRITTP